MPSAYDEGVGAADGRSGAHAVIAAATVGPDESRLLMRRGGGASTTSTALTMDLVPALSDRSLAPHVKTVSPVVTGSQSVTYDGTDHTVPQFIGTYPGYVSASNYTVARGALFGGDDSRKVVLLGSTVATELFGRVDPLGKQVTVSGKLFTVVAVLAEKGGSGFNDPNDIAIAPVSAVQESLTATARSTSCWCRPPVPTTSAPPRPRSPRSSTGSSR
jgi:putative ABC transport system permease protein